MKIIVGLGNPGRKYQSTRHNVGFMVIDELARSLHVDVVKKKHYALLVQTRIDTIDIVLAKPQTFMNDSGSSVAAILRTANVAVADLIVIHDELDLSVGSIRVKMGGGHGGHNGLRSLIAYVGSPEFIRVRVGIGRPEPGMDAADFVLSRFLADERRPMVDAMVKAKEAVLSVVLEGPVTAMNSFNRK